MKYPLYDLTWQEFELLVISICEEALGIGTLLFADGKDSGRDGVFTGTANKFPSENDPWTGRFIIQSKHTNNPSASCSDSEFKKVIKDELVNILALRESNEVDCYLLFTNRKLTGGAYSQLTNYINRSQINEEQLKKLNFKHEIIAKEKIDKFINDFPNIRKKNNLSKLLIPFEFYEEDLKDLILTFSNTSFNPNTFIELQSTFTKIPLHKKNILNKMGEAYFNNSFKKSIDNFAKIKNFLENPENTLLLKKYENTISDINDKIILRRDEYGAFEEIITYIYDYILNSNIELLKDNRKLIRIFLHYMYFNCDIGIIE